MIKFHCPYLNKERETILLLLEGEKVMPSFYCIYDPFLDIDLDPQFVILHQKEQLIAFWLEGYFQDQILELLEKGFDQKIKGRYSIPEWNIEDYTAGELLVESWQRLNLKKFPQEAPSAIKFLTRKNLKFPALKI